MINNNRHNYQIGVPDRIPFLRAIMKERNLKYAISINFEEIKLPPFQDILIVGRNCSQGKIGLTKSFEMLVPNGYESIETDDDRVELVFINKHILKKMTTLSVMSILEKNVFPFVSEGELIRVDFKINISIDNLEITATLE